MQCAYLPSGAFDLDRASAQLLSDYLQDIGRGASEEYREQLHSVALVRLIESYLPAHIQLVRAMQVGFRTPAATNRAARPKHARPRRQASVAWQAAASGDLSALFD